MCVCVFVWQKPPHHRENCTGFACAAGRFMKKRYGTAYSEERFPAELLQSWHHPDRASILPGIHLPADNVFIAEDFTLHGGGDGDDSSSSSSSSPGAAAAAVGLSSDSGPSLLAVPGGVPSLLVCTDAMRLWHHPDRTFRVPRATVNLRLISPVVSESPGGNVMAELFARVVTETMNAYSYFAEIAGG